MSRRGFAFLKVAALLIAGAVAVSGCKKSDTRMGRVQTLNDGVEPKSGQTVLVEQSHTVRPDWTVRPYRKFGDTIEFTGSVKGIARYEVGVRQAKAEALKNIVESIGSDITTALRKTDEGDNHEGLSLQSFISDRLVLSTRKISLGGVTPTEVYYQKYKVLGAYGPEYRYDIDIRLVLDDRDYQIARTHAVEELRREARKTRIPEIESAMAKAFGELDTE